MVPNQHNRILKSHFSNIIYTIPKSIVEIHEVKKETEPKPIVQKSHHVLFEFTSKPNPIENDVNDNVEYIVDIGDVYRGNDETEKNEYNPMFFSLRHYISNTNA